jgi:hypothetical protein
MKTVMLLEGVFCILLFCRMLYPNVFFCIARDSEQCRRDLRSFPSTVYYSTSDHSLPGYHASEK